MRDNSKRITPNLQDDISSQLIAHQTQQSSQEQEGSNSEKLFNFATPTEFVELPSKGKFYQPGHPLHNVEKVEIRFMTAKDEDILTSKSLLRQGIAIDRLIENVVLDKRIKARELLSGDKNALIVGTRITGFGPEYTTKVSCPACASISKYNFDLSMLSTAPEPDYEELGVEPTEEGTFMVKLPRTGVDVEVKLLTAKDESDLSETMERREKKGLPISAATSQLASFIVSINGVNSRGSILEFINNMPSFDSRHLREVYSKLVPNISMEQEFVCPVCDAEQEVDIPITVDFFWAG